MQLWAAPHFCSISPVPSRSSQGPSHHIRAATFRSLGPGCPWCTLLALKSIVCIPSALSWDPSPGQLPSESISAPLPLPARSPHVWCVHISKTRRVQKEWGRKKKKKRESGPATRGFTGARSSGPSALELGLDERGGRRGARHKLPTPTRFL